MFAGTLLIGGTAAALSTWRTYMGIIEHNRRLQEGLNVAHTAIEQLLAAPAGHPRLRGFTDDRDAFSQPGTDYHLTVTSRANRPANGFVELNVDVSWTETSGTKHVGLVVFRSD